MWVGRLAGDVVGCVGGGRRLADGLVDGGGSFFRLLVKSRR